jgi:hypothetical protein
VTNTPRLSLQGLCIYARFLYFYYTWPELKDLWVEWLTLEIAQLERQSESYYGA